jgi:peptide/nickel transport system permease protein
VGWFSILGRQARRMLLTALLGGLLGATLVRLGPGFGVDERELNLHLSAESVAAVRQERANERDIPTFYWHYLRGLLRGDFGVSHSLNRPVSELLAERLPYTLKSLAVGGLGGTALGLALAVFTIFRRVAVLDLLASGASGLCLSLPSAAIALIFLWLGWNGRWAIALVVFPHVYRYAKNVLVSVERLPHVLQAQAKGIGRGRLVWAHVLRPAAPELAAVAGIAATLAFGASIPVEVVCDMPGIGQLAWQAALGRDLPVVVNITMLVALMTLAVNGAADLALAARASGDRR